MRIHSLSLRLRAALVVTTAAVLGAGASAAPAGAREPFVGPLHTVNTVGSTVPGNGDVNPYGTVLIKHDSGDLHKGSVLVSNFNNSQNLQGTGTTLVQVAPDGTLSQFAQIDPSSGPAADCVGGIGLTTALTVLPGGWVVVGSLPTTDGSSATAQAGCLLVLDNHGTVREALTGDGINGPWDMTSVSHGEEVSDLFVTNVLNDTVANSPNTVNKGTVLRITLRKDHDGVPRRVHTTEIGSGFGERTDPAALVIGPTGLGLGENGTLYVADTLGNRITAIPDAVHRHDSAGTGRVVTTGGALNGPLGLAIAPNDDILTVNSQDGNLVETTPHGDQVAVRTLDSTPGQPNPGAGTLFGLAVDKDCHRVFFVDDGSNTVNVLEQP